MTFLKRKVSGVNKKKDKDIRVMDRTTNKRR